MRTCCYLTGCDGWGIMHILGLSEILPYDGRRKNGERVSFCDGWSGAHTDGLVHKTGHDQGH